MNIEKRKTYLQALDAIGSSVTYLFNSRPLVTKASSLAILYLQTTGMALMAAGYVLVLSKEMTTFFYNSLFGTRATQLMMLCPNG